MKPILKLLTLFFLINLLGCSPTIVKLSPLYDNITWYRGKQFIELKNERLKMWVIFDRVEIRYYVFDIEILNNSEKDFLIDPNNFYYAIMRTKNNDTTYQAKIPAVDPESKIIQINKSITGENQSYAVSSGLGALIGLAGIFVDAANIGQNSAEDEEAIDVILDDHFSQMEESRISHEITMQNLNDQRDYWEFEPLRKTTLFKDESISGKVFFPIYKSADYLKFYFPFGDTVFSFITKQEKY
jgi:hypothetical protein